MKNKTVRQHQLPRGYFRSYSQINKDYELVFFDKSGRNKYIQSASSQTIRDNLYEVEGRKVNELENWFSDLEAKWSKVLRDSKTSTFDTRNFNKLLDFALYTALRREDSINIYSRIYESEGSTNGRYEYLDSKNLEKMVERIKDNFPPKYTQYGVISTGIDENSFYVGSDNPIIFGDCQGYPIESYMVGLSCIRSVTFPISSTRLFVATRTGDKLPGYIINNHNQLQILLANEIVFTDKSRQNLLEFEFSAFVERLHEIRSDPVVKVVKNVRNGVESHGGFAILPDSSTYLSSKGVEIPLKGSAIKRGTPKYIQVCLDTPLTYLFKNLENIPYYEN